MEKKIYFFLFTFLLFAGNMKGEWLLMDMVHHNPGETPFTTQFTNPQKLKNYNFKGMVVNEFTPPSCAVLYDELNPNIFPAGSTERKWVENLALRIENQITDMHAIGLKAYYFMDIIVFPKKLVELYKSEICNSSGKIDWDKPKTQEIHRMMLKEIFTRFPQLDGLVIRTGETYTHNIPYHQGNGPVDNSNKTLAIRIHAELMNLLREEVCVKYGKTILYRTWDYASNAENGYFHTQPEYYLGITNQVAPHANLYLGIKHTGGDYFRTFPFNKTIGIGQHKQVIEVQCQREYDGKCSYANYIADGVINGFEELKGNSGMICLNDFKNDERFSGVWTWSRGGGWGGPYLTDKNEFWCDVNAYVMAQWANNTSRTEAEIFKEYALMKGFDETSAEKLHQIALLSADANIRGRASLIYTMPQNRLEWTRDASLQGINVLGGLFNTIISNNIVDEALAEKKESVTIWNQMTQLAQELNCTDANTLKNVQVSTEYGRLLFSITYNAWFVMLKGYATEKYGRAYDYRGMMNAFEAYDNFVIEYKKLRKNEPLCATLYDGYETDKDTELKKSVEYYRAYNPPAPNLLLGFEIVHAEEDKLGEEITSSIGGFLASDIHFVAVSGSANLSWKDCRALVTTFPNLKGLDLSKAKFANNKIPAAQGNVGSFENLPAGSIKLPSGLAEIPAYTFKNSANLKGVIVYASSVGENAFTACPSLKSIYYTSNQLPSNTTVNSFPASLKLYVPYGKREQYSSVLTSQIIQDGTSANKYKIEIAEDLDAMRLYPAEKNTYFQFAENIDVGNFIAGHAEKDIRSFGWAPMGSSSLPVSGNIDGNGYFIRNIWMDRSGLTAAGLFAFLTNATIQKLGIAVAAKGMKGGDNTGGFVGMSNTVSFEQCCIIGDISGGKQVGGILGHTDYENTVMKQCYATGLITATDGTGGLWGKTTNKNSKIEECYAVNSIAGGGGTAGGLLAVAFDTSSSTAYVGVKNSMYAGQSINGSYAAGRIIGFEKRSGVASYENNIALDITTVNGSVAGSVGNNKNGINKDMHAIGSQDTYNTWDFDNVWKMGNGQYPLPVFKNLVLSEQPTVCPLHLLSIAIPTNIETVEKNNQIKVYPNPVETELYINNKPNNATVALYDYTGKLLYRTKNNRIDLTNFSGGLYIVNIENEKIKIIKK